MGITNNWKSLAVCVDDKFSNRWVSYNIEDVKYAKDGCSRCPVRQECFINAIENDSMIGVIAGISEFEFLLYTWEEVNDINESNWRRDRKTFSRLLQKIQ